MRKLKLEVQISIDGFVADVQGKTDWMVWDWKPEWNWDEDLKQYHIDLHTSSDTILLGRKMAEGGFFEHWKDIAKKPEDPQYAFARPITEMKKYVFTKKLRKSKWGKDAELVKGNFIKEIHKLKKQKGKDIIVYGGAKFVSSLIKAHLIDEYHLIINPTVLGIGKSIFKEIENRQNLILNMSKKYDDGIVLQNYVSKIIGR